MMKLPLDNPPYKPVIFAECYVTMYSILNYTTNFMNIVPNADWNLLNLDGE